MLRIYLYEVPEEPSEESEEQRMHVEADTNAEACSDDSNEKVAC